MEIHFKNLIPQLKLFILRDNTLWSSCLLVSIRLGLGASEMSGAVWNKQ